MVLDVRYGVRLHRAVGLEVPKHKTAAHGNDQTARERPDDTAPDGRWERYTPEEVRRNGRGSTPRKRRLQYARSDDVVWVLHQEVLGGCRRDTDGRWPAQPVVGCRRGLQEDADLQDADPAGRGAGPDLPRRRRRAHSGRQSREGYDHCSSTPL